MKSEQILEKISEAILDIAPDSEIRLFGSRARGDFRPDSDWDILVILPENNQDEIGMQTKVNRAMYALELELDIAISPLVFLKKNWEKMGVTSLFQNVEKQGVLV